MFDRKKYFCLISFFIFLLFLAAQASAVVIGPPPPPPTPTITITEIQPTYEEGKNITIGGMSENLALIKASLIKNGSTTNLSGIIPQTDGSWTLDLGSGLVQGLYQLNLNSPSGIEPPASAQASFEVVAPPPPPNQPPDCSGAYPSTICLWPANHKFINITIEGVVDPDNESVSITIVSVTSDEPTSSDKGSGGAKHAPDATIEDGAVQLRAERSGNEDGRVYKITFIATDERGLESEGYVLVSVPHDAADGCNARDSGQIYDATGIN